MSTEAEDILDEYFPAWRECEEELKGAKDEQHAAHIYRKHGMDDKTADEMAAHREGTFEGDVIDAEKNPEVLDSLK
jgi:hypothetical protein